MHTDIRRLCLRCLHQLRRDGSCNRCSDPEFRELSEEYALVYKLINLRVQGALQEDGPCSLASLTAVPHSSTPTAIRRLVDLTVAAVSVAAQQMRESFGVRQECLWAVPEVTPDHKPDEVAAVRAVVAALNDDGGMTADVIIAHSRTGDIASSERALIGMLYWTVSIAAAGIVIRDSR